MTINWDALDREEEDLADQLANGSITQAEYDDTLWEIRRSVAEEHDQDREAAMRRVDEEYGIGG